jgi:hypothetical protein
MAGDTAKAKSAYQDFFALWKDADPDIPILKEAKRSTQSCSSSPRTPMLIWLPISRGTTQRIGISGKLAQYSPCERSQVEMAL